jgi:hypothetical protein
MFAGSRVDTQNSACTYFRLRAVPMAYLVPQTLAETPCGIGAQEVSTSNLSISGALACLAAVFEAGIATHPPFRITMRKKD